MNKQQTSLGAIITKALQDEDFRQRLNADPAGTLKAEGIEVPESVTVRVVADTENVRHVVLPAVGALSDDALMGVAGGDSDCTEYFSNAAGYIM